MSGGARVKKGWETLLYADDTQIYVSLKPSSKEDIKIRFEVCLSDLRTWFVANKLCCNSSKTNFIYFTPLSRFPSPSLSIQFGSSTLYPVDSALNLGVSWDKHLRMKLQIGRICKAASLGLFRIGALNNLLDKISMERLVHAFISSRLDYGNALLFGLSTKELNRLQVIQNAAARLISGAKKHDHITPVLKSLHWLPIKHELSY